MRYGRTMGATALVFCALAVPAGAALAPLDGQVNNDPSAATGIDPAKNAGASDVVGGALTAGALEIPWATFEQDTTGAQNVFVRAFKNGAWVTEGFPATLNIDPTKEAEGPSIDFAGADRTVPWVAWYEPNDAFGDPTQVFASRFAADAAAQGGGRWVPEGQDRAAGAKVPSLNIHTTRTAEDPAVAGGATLAGAAPVPWVAWKEADGGATDATSTFQVFVAKGVKLAAAGANCPPGTKPAGAASVGTFCWQQVGLDRLNATAGTPSAAGDPSLSVDPTRNSQLPDMAFTGPGDTVAWVVWYEEDASTLPGLTDTNEQVFAAKLVADAGADGGFHWQAVGNGTAGKANTLDTSGANGFGACTATKADEEACTLNKVATNGAENPRVATGSLAPGAPTVPWVVWQEHQGGPAGTPGIFVSRLVGGDHFELFNGGSPISNPLNESTDADITFSGHVPYISWHENVGGQERLFTGHFEGGAAAPAFKLDTPDGIAASGFGLTAGLRSPISSTCTATPFSADGTTCRGGAAGTPFTLFTDGSADGGRLIGEAYAPTDVTTGAASAITASGATLAGSANPGGAPVKTRFDAGTTTAYGTSAASTLLGASTTLQPFAATVGGLPAASTIHYRATASSDFTTVAGADRTFTTTAQTAPAANKRPSSRITGLKKKVHRRTFKRIKGKASDPDGGVRRVDIAIVRLVDGAKASRARCLVLSSKGTLKPGKTAKGRCVPSFLKAKGTTSWSFKLKKKLPRGRYVVYSRATDKQGLKQKGFTSKSRKTFRVVR
jgi:hypothetical protein